jgi:2-polyprenyl-3-methyl-5-hydroxy-6-metoxy-1,4-benzoquinol methylase
MRCSSCGQITSQASEARYWDTMTQFDRPDFNDPSGRTFSRRDHVARKRLRSVARLLSQEPANIRILDVGCSRGQFVASATAAGFAAEGVEPAPQMVTEARARGLKIHQGLLEEQNFPAGSFNAVTLFEVVEHLKDPIHLLLECRRVLTPNGILVISTGNASSWTAAMMRSRWDYFDMSKDGGHISFFNPQSIRQLASNVNFDVVTIRTARVKFHDKIDTSPWLYSACKIFAELLNLPAQILDKGHDMLVYLRPNVQQASNLSTDTSPPQLPSRVSE